MSGAPEADRFVYRAPDARKAERHQLVREAFVKLLESLDGVVPAGRERALFVTQLETAAFWANAAIAREVTE